MARPRVFVSSTFYDLKQVRADLEKFIREMGYEPVLHERGSIPYGSEQKLEEYAYREVEQVDILISIVGGRYGTGSQHGQYSIAQMELRRAVELDKPVFIFVERSVLAEFSTYQANKDTERIRYPHVDDVRVYQFLEEIHNLPRNNPIAPFETSDQIIQYLREQWAGLLHNFLQERARIKGFQIIADIQQTAETLKQLVTYLSKGRESQQEAIESILLIHHPAFQQIKAILKVPYRVCFVNHDELAAWLAQRRYQLVPVDQWDDPGREEWVSSDENTTSVLRIDLQIFDGTGKLRIYTPEGWNSGWISLDVSRTPKSQEISDDDVPF